MRTLSSNDIVVLVGKMVDAPYERIRDFFPFIKLSKKLAKAGADAIQFSIYTPFPGTRIFDDTLYGGPSFTLDWGGHNALTPVMKARLGPVMDQMPPTSPYILRD